MEQTDRKNTNRENFLSYSSSPYILNIGRQPSRVSRPSTFFLLLFLFFLVTSRVEYILHSLEHDEGVRSAGFRICRWENLSPAFTFPGDDGRKNVISRVTQLCTSSSFYLFSGTDIRWGQERRIGNQSPCLRKEEYQGAQTGSSRYFNCFCSWLRALSPLLPLVSSVLDEVVAGKARRGSGSLLLGIGSFYLMHFVYARVTSSFLQCFLADLYFLLL